MKPNKRNVSIVLFCVFPGIFLANCSKITKELKEDWANHSQLVYNFKCLNPQARSLELTELFQPDDPLLLEIENVYPSSTVLHRCENAGCCTGIKQCAAQETETVNLIFGIVQPKISKIQYIHKDVLNHTLCTCQ